MNTRLRFVTKDDGKTFWPYTENISSSLRRPLQNLLRIIIKELLNYPKPPVTSLANATSNLSRQDLRIVEVGSELCRQSREVRYDQNRFTVWLHTTHPRTSFEDSGGLMEAVINLLTALGHCAIRKSFELFFNFNIDDRTPCTTFVSTFEISPAFFPGLIVAWTYNFL